MPLHALVVVGLIRAGRQNEITGQLAHCVSKSVIDVSTKSVALLACQMDIALGGFEAQRLRQTLYLPASSGGK